MASLTESLNLARQRVLAGEQLSLDEQRQLIQMLRDARGAAMPQPKEKKGASKKSSKPAISDEQLDADLDSLLGL